MSYAALVARLQKGGPVLLDGPMGSELVRRGIRWRKHGLLTDQQTVEQLHREYLAAGAHILRTNTFQLNPRVYRNVFRNARHMQHIGAPGLQDLAQRLARAAVELARRARAEAGLEHRVAIAGVLAPLEHCYRPDLSPPPATARAEHAEMARVLAEAGVDFLLLESMNTLGEAVAAVEAARATGLPVWASFVPGPEGELLSGEPLVEAARAVTQAGASAVLINCGPPELLTDCLRRLVRSVEVPVGAFALIGRFSPPSWKFEFHPQFIETETWPPDRYAEEAAIWRAIGATIVGGCCGTGPAHTAALARRLHIEVQPA